MHAHLKVIPLPVPDADSLGELERQVLDETDPPLNLMGPPQDLGSQSPHRASAAAEG